MNPICPVAVIKVIRLLVSWKTNGFTAKKSENSTKFRRVCNSSSPEKLRIVSTTTVQLMCK